MPTGTIGKPAFVGIVQQFEHGQPAFYGLAAASADNIEWRVCHQNGLRRKVTFCQFFCEWLTVYAYAVSYLARWNAGFALGTLKAMTKYRRASRAWSFSLMGSSRFDDSFHW